MVDASLKTKLANFPKMSNKDTKRLYELQYILSEIESYKEDKKFQCLLGYFDSSSGIRPIVAKLPYTLQEKWTSKGFQLKLGWVIVGETCLDRQHKSSHLSVMRTHVLPSGRPSILQPCENQFKVKEQLSRNGEIGVPCKPAHTLEFIVFERTNNDDKPGMSHEDKQF
jgi:hypothetical protein